MKRTGVYLRRNDKIQRDKPVIFWVVKQVILPINIQLQYLMSSGIGSCYDFVSNAQTSIWNDKLLSAGQQNDTNEGIIVINTDTQKITKRTK